MQFEACKYLLFSEWISMVHPVAFNGKLERSTYLSPYLLLEKRIQTLFPRSITWRLWENSWIQGELWIWQANIGMQKGTTSLTSYTSLASCTIIYLIYCNRCCLFYSRGTEYCWLIIPRLFVWNNYHKSTSSTARAVVVHSKVEYNL